MIMAIISLAARGWLKHFAALAAIRIVGVIGVCLVLASSTPFPLWAYAVWLVLWVAPFVVPFQRARRLIFLPFLLISGVLCLLEVPHCLTPKIPVSQDQHIYVLGDSLSAGISPSERTWPLVLGDLCRLNVTNLAQPGATTADALRQDKGILEPKSLILIEIGGNDLLGSASSEEFSRKLDQLLSDIPSTCSCAMFELPLLPFCSGYGEAQRNLARKHNVILIPKKCLVKVIGGNGNTLDGLHLSQKGHDALAHAVSGMLSVRR